MDHSSDAQTEEPIRKEYSIILDGVIAIPKQTDSKEFFDGLLDAVLEYSEKFDARVAVSIGHKEVER